MKYLLIAVVLLSSCAPFRPLQNIEVRYLMDFSKYSDEGFMISPYSYNGDYQPRGVIGVDIYPSTVLVGSDARNNAFWEKTHRSVFTKHGYVWVEKLNPDKYISLAVDDAKALGADAIADFEVNFERMYIDGVPIDVLKISGFAIKRK